MGEERRAQLAAGTDRTHMTVNSFEMMNTAARDDGSSPDCQGSMAEEVKRRRKKKKQRSMVPIFSDLYKLTGETLGEGSYGKVQTCVNITTSMEYAVKTIEKKPGLYSRSKVMKEIEIYYICRGQNNIIQLIEYFEEADRFFLIFEKANGGPLLDHIQERGFFTEAEASSIVKDLAESLMFLHRRGIAHRDLKSENVLCVHETSPCPVKLCDFDLCTPAHNMASTPQLMTPVGSCEYMAPEVVNTFTDNGDNDDNNNQLYYDKKCALWSLGVIMYILLCGYPPFSGNCGSGCGWEEGGSCEVCQDMLFTSIKEGRVIFLEKDWAGISQVARDLIKGLLVKDASLRLDASEVTRHPWIVHGGCSTRLETPRNLRRQTSVRELTDFAASAVAVNRAMVDQRSSEMIHSFNLSPTSRSTCLLMERRRERNSYQNNNRFLKNVISSAA